MDFRDSPEEAGFRSRLRAWLADNVPHGGFPPEAQERNSFRMEWHRTLYKGGWVGLSWPKAVGGQELGPMYDAIVHSATRFATARAFSSVSSTATRRAIGMVRPASL